MATVPPAEQRKSSGLLDLEKELVCSICTEVLYQPLTLLDCLHTFCGSCLKEWFSWQAQRAKNSSAPVLNANPYTCPSCRASVRDTRPNATVTTLLEMFLKANPGRDRSQTEKDEIKQQYRVGEVVIPKLEGPRRRSRDNRHTSGRHADQDDEDRRLLEEVRERSRTDFSAPARPERRHAHTHLDPSDVSSAERSRSREHEREIRHRRTREEDRRRRQAGEVAERDRAMAAASVPTTQAVREADHRQRERQIEHQSSLRSLMSASDGEGAMEEEILRQIIDEGLLEGINFDDLDVAQEEELSERIAEAYRQRHPSRRLPQTANRPSASETGRRHQRSRSTQSADREDPRNTASTGDSRLPPVSRPRLLEASDSEPSRHGHRRRSSDQGRRQTSPNPRTARTNSEEAVIHQAARSATDLSRPQSSDASTTRPRHSSDVRRSANNSDQPRISDMWRNAAVRTNTDPISRTVPGHMATESPQHLSPTNEHPTISTNDPCNTVDRPIPNIGVVQETSTRNRQDDSLAAPENGRDITHAALETSYLEPSASCDRCSKPSIQYKLHKHCSTCSMNVCLQCYRKKRACRHWFGFGFTAKINFATSMPPNSAETTAPPHVMTSRKYLPPPSNSAVRSEIDQTSSVAAIYTSSNPSERLQEGKFCDRCEEFANPCHWECAICNEGEWGFCNECVNTHHCCVHPLLPIAHKDFAPGAKDKADTRALRRSSIPSHASILPISSDVNSRPSTSDEFGRVELEGSSPALDNFGIGPEYVRLTFTAHCDICSYPIPPSSTRFHCPFHQPSPPSDKGQGDYDICMACYTSLAKTSAISPTNGINGWRRCPKGHRMVITGFEERGEGQRRVVVKDLVGGWALKDEYYETSGAQPNNNTSTETGTWSWRDSPEATTRASRSKSRSNTTTNITTFPPSGGIGLHCQAKWSYLPDHEKDPDELLFPKGAEIREAEDINGDWFWGVYMGDKGVFYGNYVDVIGGTGLRSE